MKLFSFLFSLFFFYNYDRFMLCNSNCYKKRNRKSMETLKEAFIFEYDYHMKLY